MCVNHIVCYTQGWCLSAWTLHDISSSSIICVNNLKWLCKNCSNLMQQKCYFVCVLKNGFEIKKSLCEMTDSQTRPSLDRKSTGASCINEAVNCLIWLDASELCYLLCQKWCHVVSGRLWCCTSVGLGWDCFLVWVLCWFCVLADCGMECVSSINRG